MTTRIKNHESRITATLFAGATAAACVALNFIPRRGVIVTSDQGEWPGSWRLEFGWPSTSYTEFGYDAFTRMGYWTLEGLSTNALIASAAVILAVLLALVRPRDS